MKLTEQQLREILQRKPVRPEAGRRDCLTSDQFVRAALGEMTDKERRNVARHLVDCMDCTEAYRAVRALEPWALHAQQDVAKQDAARHDAAHRDAAERDPALPEQVLRTPGLMTPLRAQPSDPAKASSTWSAVSAESARTAESRRASPFAAFERLFRTEWMRPIGAVVLIIAVAGGSFIIWRSITHQEPSVSTERAGVALKLTVEPPNNAILSAVPEKLSWSALDHALTYQVMLYDFQSTPVWQSPRLTVTSVSLPDEIRQQVRGNQPYYWRVIAEDAIEQRQSELFQFTVAQDRRQ